MSALAALADPVRARIVEMLAERDRSAGEIGEHFPISQPAISRHLRVLRNVRLVTARGDAQRRVYSLDPTAFDEIDEWVTRCRRIWNRRFDSLERHLDAVAAKKSRGGEK
ncbi:MAG TPA: metalloregulator ArsR/SmtB family transcription factor [Candidatus Binataceae bacterium]